MLLNTFDSPGDPDKKPKKNQKDGGENADGNTGNDNTSTTEQPALSENVTNSGKLFDSGSGLNRQQDRCATAEIMAQNFTSFREDPCKFRVDAGVIHRRSEGESVLSEEMIQNKSIVVGGGKGGKNGAAGGGTGITIRKFSNSK
jgi:hypothetical protein